jgi:hypothetical protein
MSEPCSDGGQAQTEITVTAQTVQGDQEESFTFEQETKVSEAAQHIADSFGLESTTDLVLFHDGERLQDNRPLVSYDLNGKTVTLSSNRGGV